MSRFHSSVARAAVCAVLLLAAGGASAEPGFVRIPQPPPRHGGFHGFPMYWPVEQETVIIEREVIREVPAEPAPAPVPPPPPRKPYAIGESYDSLPGGCMKLIEDGQSFYLAAGNRTGRWRRAATRRSRRPDALGRGTIPLLTR